MSSWDTRPAILAALIGSGIQASLTPALHEREGAEQALRYVYRLVDIERLGLGVEALPDLLRGAERMGFTGLNITHPCKQAVIPFLDELSEDARALGAVNTVVLRDRRRIGHNTDWWGFAEGFRRGLPDVRRERVVQLGAGGAGAAVAHAALTLGVDRLRSSTWTPQSRRRSRQTFRHASARAARWPARICRRRWRRRTG